MFNNLFDCNLTSYSTFPVTSNFVSKFNICPHKYFCLLGDKVNCYINKDKNEIIVYDYKENEDEEYEYLYYCYFNYKITTEGFIDDIMLNYIK